MGFDFYIKARLNICKETGKFYTWSYTAPSNFQTIYDINIVVPEEHRRFVDLHGHFLHSYTISCEGDDKYEADVSELLESFPSWDDVSDSDSIKRYDWTEDDHNAFKKALEWFKSQRISFYATWSY